MSFLDDWQYDLPAHLIATRPAQQRDGSRLLQVPINGGAPVDRAFTHLATLLRPGDLLVANNTRVMASRVRAHRSTGGAVELLLLQPGPGPIEALARPARRLKVGEVLQLEAGGTATIVARPDAEGILLIETDPDPVSVMAAQGEMPLPPYLGRGAEAGDAVRYQTVFAGPLGASAAPTAGLHFTPDVLAAVAQAGIGWATLTLHVGIGTFRPLRPEDVAAGKLHPEWLVIPQQTVEAISETRSRGGRVIAVGTTSARALEASTSAGDRVPQAGARTTRLFIQPGYDFRCVDGLLTNFHLPGSSLLMLVAGLIGRERLFSSYETAVQRGYRFYSYGDAMLLL